VGSLSAETVHAEDEKAGSIRDPESTVEREDYEQIESAMKLEISNQIILTCRSEDVSTWELPHSGHELSKTADEETHTNDCSVTIDATGADRIERPEEDRDGKSPHPAI
jgi:hypothetical protein